MIDDQDKRLLAQAGLWAVAVVLAVLGLAIVLGLGLRLLWAIGGLG